MASTDLRVKFLGRKTKPYALAVSLTLFVLAYMLFGDLAVGELLDGWQGMFAGVVASVGAGLLTVGWWWQRQHFLEWGLLLSAGAWMSVSVILSLEFNPWYHNALLAFCWVLASIGAWMLERAADE